jgi:hypothetical protein
MHFFLNVLCLNAFFDERYLRIYCVMTSFHISMKCECTYQLLVLGFKDQMYIITF